MKKLFLLLFVLSLLIENANANGLYIKKFMDEELTAEQTQNKYKQLSDIGVLPAPAMEFYGEDIKCVDGDTIHVSTVLIDDLKGNGMILDAATYSFRISGIDAFDNKSRKMIKKQKKATGLSETEIKKKAQHGKEYCEEYFIRQKKCLKFYVYGVDHYGRFIVIPCDGEYQRNLVDKGLATIYKGNDLYKLIFDEDY